MSKVTALYHIVFCTYNRNMTISEVNKESLYRFIWKILKDSNCHLFRIGGIANHVHMLINLSPSISLSDLMRKIKSLSSKWMKDCGEFPYFEKWAHEYFAATLSWEERGKVIEYIKSQPEHHKSMTLDNELDNLLHGEGLTLHPNDFK